MLLLTSERQLVAGASDRSSRIRLEEMLSDAQNSLEDAQNDLNATQGELAHCRDVAEATTKDLETATTALDCERAEVFKLRDQVRGRHDSLCPVMGVHQLSHQSWHAGRHCVCVCV